MTPEQIAELPYRPNVGVMLMNAQGRVWVGQRIDNPGAAWQMPQGGIDKGEDPHTAALRELEEETGVRAAMVTVVTQTRDWVRYDLPHDLVPNIWGGRWRGQEQMWFLLRFNGCDDDIRIDTDHPEFSEWMWCDPSELVDRIVPFKREVYARVLAEFSDHMSVK